MYWHEEYCLKAGVGARTMELEVTWQLAAEQIARE